MTYNKYENLKVFDYINKVVILNPELPSWISINKQGFAVFEGLRNNLSLTEISESCELPVKIVNEFKDEFDDVLFTKSDTKYSDFDSMSATVFLTDACNFNCRHCFYSCSNKRKDANFLDFDNQFLPFLNDFVKAGGLYITFTGGEPLVVDVIKYIRESYNRGVKSAVLTNGSLIDDDFCRCAKECGSYVQVSVDGDEKTFSKVRRGGNYTDVIRGLDKLSKAKIDFDVSYMPCKSNINSFGNVLSLAIEYGAKSFHMPLLEEFGNANDNIEALYLDQNEIISFLDSIIADYFYGGLNDKIKFDFLESIVDDLSQSIKKISCPLGRHFGALYADGKLYPCSEVIIKNFELGQYKQGSFTRNEKILNLSFNVDEIEKCNNCEFKYYCGGGCRLHSYLKYKSFHKEDSYCKLLKHCYKKILGIIS